MDKLQKQLHLKLLENSSIEIKHSSKWSIPVITYDVYFKRVKRSQMDILMKMMLLTFEQTEIRRAANLSELLLVEELFISELLKKMQRMGLVTLINDSYKLTSKGQEQLNTGIIVEETDEEQTEAFYSYVHDAFWSEMSDTLPETNEDLPLFRYENKLDVVNEDRIMQVLVEKENGQEEDGFQAVVERITHFEQQKIEYIPCLEFQMYNQEQDLFYSRVWNTWLGRWDEILEKQIEEKEMLEWREKLQGIKIE